MNRKIFERIRETHLAWQADELADGELVGRDYAEKESSYPELLAVRDDLPRAERSLQGPEANAARLPELLGSIWGEMIKKAGHEYPVDEGDPPLGYQVGFMRGMVAVLTEYETELAKEWSAPKPSKERKAK